MKKLALTLAIILMFITVLTVFPPAASAAVSVSVSASPSTAKVGATVTVTVTVKGSNLGAIQGTFSYDSAYLEYTGGSNSGNGTIAASSAAASSIKATMKFKTKKEGSATVSVKITSALDYDTVASVGSGSGSRTITISNTATPKPPSTGGKSTPKPTQNIAQTEIPVTLDGKQMYIHRSLEGKELPSGYTAKDLSYNGENIQSASNAEGTLTLLYVSDDKGENASFCMYEAAGGTLLPYKTVAVNRSYILVAVPPADITPPDGFTPATLTINETQISCFKSEADPSFYLLYLINSSGKGALYLLDETEGSIQRYSTLVTVEVTPEPTPVPTPSPTPVPKTEEELASEAFNAVIQRPEVLYIIGAMTVIAIALIVTVTLLVIKNKKLKRRRRRPRPEDGTAA